jgi:drug/metabolite transporter (DMT)-like permease
MLWTWSLTQTSVANANILASLNPIFTTLGGWLLFQQLFDRKFLMGMLLAIVGALVLGFQDLIISDKSLNGDFAALVCSMLCAIAYLILEYLRSRLSVVTVLTWLCLGRN